MRQLVVGQMVTKELTATRPSLLFDVRDWQNAPAWLEFFRRYDPLVASWCRTEMLHAAEADEIRSNVWIEIAQRIRTFRYDPRRRFRGWLRELCRSRTIDFLRKRQRDPLNLLLVDNRFLSDLSGGIDLTTNGKDDRDSTDSLFDDVRREADEIQQIARKRIGDCTWNVFWQIAIADRPIAEVARDHQMTYAAAYAAYARAKRVLRETGEQHGIGHS
ncbi:MAG: sigma-70 family RNA polymerase sigma factor [Planctomycetaceae bacterium]|nr:sigma-70 family RNA polymerase sigma factor [Planctomycetaceae bacterium]